MRIYKYIHSCLIVEEGKTRILFDPGKFSFMDNKVSPRDLTDLSAIVITHQHPDHIDDESLKEIVEYNPIATVLTNGEIQSRLANLEIKSEVFESGTRAVEEITIHAIAASHAPILNAVAPQNIAYIVNDVFLHPGDSFDHSLDAFNGIDLLALPVMAPWNTELQVAEFAKRIKPKQIIPIHDGYVKEFFVEQRYQNYQKYFSEIGIEFRPLNKPGDYFEL